MHPRSMITTLALVVLLSASTASSAPLRVRIDLAEQDPGSERTLPFSPGEYQVEITNKVPTKSYNIQGAVSAFTIPPLQAPGAGAAGLLPGNPCLDLANATGNVNNAKDEDAVATAVAAVEEELGKGNCLDPDRQKRAQEAIDSTRETLAALFQVASGQELKVVVSQGAGKDQKQWTVTYQTPARGRWFSSYGFVFVRNQDETYFSKAKAGTTDKFTITRKVDNQDYDFAPSLFFSWLPARLESRNFSFGPAAGLGFDQSNPIVFLGPMLTYNQNISLVAGVVMHKQKRLSGNYKVDQDVAENLTEAQLREETFRPNVFFGLSIRFGSNPFEAKKKADTPTVKPAAANP